MAGSPLPIPYRDAREEAARHGDKADEVFDQIQRLDAVAMEIAAERAKAAAKGNRK